MEEWLSITAAAERLTAEGDAVERSTLSRYLSQHAEAIAVRQDGRARLVEINALRQHRAENIRLPHVTLATVGRHAEAETQIVASRAGRAPAARSDGTQSAGLARKVNAEAELKEMRDSEMWKAGRTVRSLRPENQPEAIEK